LLRKIDLKMSYKFPGYQYMKSSQGVYNPYSSESGGWDGRLRLLTKSKAFPSGLRVLCEKMLKDNGALYEVVDNREPVHYGDSLDIVNKDFKPRDYQVEVVNRAYAEESGIVRSATGSGKTAMIAMLVAKYNIPTVIYVIGIELLFQMKETIESLYGIECGIVGGGYCETSKDVCIMTIWSAASAFNKKCKLIDNDSTQDSKAKNKSLDKMRVRERVSNANMIIIDECQYAASETVQFIHKASANARHKFLFSGTPWRDSGDDILIEAVGGPKFYDLNATKLINKGILVAPEIHFVSVPIMRNVGKTYHEVYSNYIVNNDERNSLIIDATRKLVAANKKVLILIVRVGHGNLLLESMKDEFRIDYLDGKKSTKQRLDAISSMKNGELDVLIASKIFDQGIDIPELDALILAGSGKSSGRALQRIGRVIRGHEGKTRATVVDFFDNAKYLRDHSEKRIDIYKSEPAFIVKLPEGRVKKSREKKATKWA
jgi:superfamily II DNA or RNA helicase